MTDDQLRRATELSEDIHALRRVLREESVHVELYSPRACVSPGVQAAVQEMVLADIQSQLQQREAAYSAL